MTTDETQKIKIPLKMKTIPMLCSWCGRIYELRVFEFQEHQKTGVSHGICPDCLARQREILDAPR
jgi:hypothetical protein